MRCNRFGKRTITVSTDQFHLSTLSQMNVLGIVAEALPKPGKPFQVCKS